MADYFGRGPALPDFADARSAYIYEKLEKGAGQVLAAHQRIEKHPNVADRLRILGLTYEDKRKHGALQAADILAYEVQKDHVNTLRGKPRPTLPASAAGDGGTCSLRRLR